MRMRCPRSAKRRVAPGRCLDLRQAPCAVRRLPPWLRATTAAGGEQVDMVFTDPPYNVNYANSAKDKMRGKDRAILNDNLGDGFYDFLLAALTPDRGALPGRHLRGDVVQRTGRAAGRLPRRRRPLVDVHHLGQEHLHAGPCRLPAPVRADPLRLARGCRAPLVRRPRPGRRVADQEAAEERSASDHEAGGTGRARDPQFQPPGQRGARSRSAVPARR
jgi:hypothetical protein